MRKLVASALVALLVAAPGAAFAASATPAPAATAKPAAAAAAEMSATGVVKAFNLTTHSLTLADGKVYQLPGTFKDPGIKVGSKVTVHWKQNGTMLDATSVSLG